MILLSTHKLLFVGYEDLRWKNYASVVPNSLKQNQSMRNGRKTAVKSSPAGLNFRCIILTDKLEVGD